jgi:hypothetical protein
MFQGNQEQHEIRPDETSGTADNSIKPDKARGAPIL